MGQTAQFKQFDSVRVRPVKGLRWLFAHSDQRRYSGQTGRIYHVETGKATMLPIYTVIFGESPIRGGVFFEDEVEAAG